MLDNINALSEVIYLTKAYNPLLIVVSVITAIVSAFTAFGTAERALKSNTSQYKIAWLSLGALSLGLGVWAMHFIGILALSLPVTINYDIVRTLISAIPSVAASAVILWSMVNGIKHTLLSGALFGISITMVHLIGLSAMKMSAIPHYNLALLTLSVVASIVLSTISLHVQLKTFSRQRHAIFNTAQFFSATIMGLAISSMHYIAMYAISYSPSEEIVEISGLSSETLAIIIGISVSIVIFLSFLIPTLLALQYKNVAAALNTKFESALARKVAITDSAYDAWVHADQTGKILGWNKSAQDTFGWTEQEVMGKPLTQFIIPYKYRPLFDKGLAHFLLNGHSHLLNKVLEIDALGKDGLLFPIELTITAISLDEGYEFSAFVRDITERKKSEEKQASLVRELKFEKNAVDAHAIVSVTDVKGDIIYTNDKFEQISHYSRKELLGQNHNIIKSGQHNGLFYKEIWQTIANGKVWHGIIKNKSKQGDYYWLSSTIVPFLDEDGNPIRYVSIATDITRHKALEEKYEHAMTALVQEKKIAERANRAKSDFLASMNHELRTPLNAILGFSQLMQSDTISPVKEHHYEQLSYIIDSGKHLLSLINDVLDLAQIESGKMVLSLENIYLDDVINDALILIHTMAEQKNITVNVIAKDRSLHVVADYTKLKQVMINLVSNAVKYNHEGGNVDVDFTAYDDEWVRITVTDSGIGIAEDDHHRVFTAFDRLGQETSNIEGTGVGLVVTKNIVELMHGKIGFDKTQSLGSTFWVDLPISTQATSGLNDAALEQQLEQRESRSFAGKTILCVEDNPLNQDLMSSFLLSFPELECHHAASAEQGLALIEQHYFDLILMDINLPDMDGISLASKIKRVDSLQGAVPIIAVSAASLAGDTDLNVFDAHITKPVDFTVLSQLIRTYLS